MRIDDGFSTTITFSLDPLVKFWEKRVTPSGIDSGGPNDTTTMRNTRWRSRSPKRLLTLTDMTATVAYDPEVYESILAMMPTGVLGSAEDPIQLITINWPDGHFYTFYGWLDKFIPGEMREGEQPEATVTICPSNQSPALIEDAPEYS